MNKHKQIEYPSDGNETDTDTSLDKNWSLVTEAMRRKVLSNSETRSSIAEFVEAPLDEQLPIHALGQVASKDSLVNRVTRSQSGLMDFLARESVPDSLLIPDISNAYRRHRDTDGESGITLEQHEQIARRYRFARDIKLLALTALLHQRDNMPVASSKSEVTWQPQENVRLVTTAEHESDGKSIMNPQLWERREQLKDRVYRIWIAGRDFIMKERKTTRHTDVKEGEHIDGLTAREEFEVANHFAGVKPPLHPDITLRWERPVGYVEMPDYQFAVFESEQDLLEGVELDDEPQKALEKKILQSKREYREEYERVRQAARKLHDERDDLLRLWSKAPRLSPRSRSLTFKEFSKIKAHLLILEARNLLTMTVLNEGYINSDKDGFGFRIEGNARPHVEIVGFDFEYYRHDPLAAEQLKRQWQELTDSGELAQDRALRMGGRRMTGAASLVMMENSGMSLPAKKG